MQFGLTGGERPTNDVSLRKGSLKILLLKLNSLVGRCM